MRPRNTFTRKAICNTREATEALLSLSLDSRAEVDDFIARAVAAGGTEEGEATDHGFMYERGVLDPDGQVLPGACVGRRAMVSSAA